MIAFPPYRLDPTNEQLSRDGEPVTLRPKAFAVLRYLAERPGRLVTKDELLGAVWPDTFVTDTVLKVCINELRRALHDDAESSKVIQTVHRRGYRFIAPLAAPGEAPASAFPPEPPKRRGASRPLGETAPLIAGRDGELAVLERALTRAAEGFRQVVFVSGEAGIGKTALLDRFLADVAAREKDAVWTTRGQCVAQYGAGEAFLPLLEALERLCREAHRADVVATMRSLAPDWLLQLPGLLTAAERADLKGQGTASAPERMLRLAVDLLEELAQDRTLILVLEDLHWSDPSTIDLIARLAERQEAARLLLLATYRPGEAIARGHPLRAVKLELQMRRRCDEILLGFLDEPAIRQYLEIRFPGAPLPNGLTAWLHRRTDGSPLFMSSVVAELGSQGVVKDVAGRAALGEGFESVGVPEDLRQMIEQQIDHLDPVEQRLLEAAAVVGADFSAAAVAAALELGLLEVEAHFDEWSRRGSVVRSSGLATWPDGTVSTGLGFIHSLHREVQYQRVPPARRALLHRRIGERLEAAYGAGSRHAPAELAVHFEECGEARRAVTYLRKIAGRAIDRGAHREALASFGHAIELLERQPPTSETARDLLSLHLAAGSSRMATSLSDEGVRNSFSAALALAEELGDLPSQFLAQTGLWGFHFSRAELKDIAVLAERLTELASRMALPAFAFVAHTFSGMGRFLAGDFASARARLEAAVATGVELPASVRPSVNGLCLGFLASTLALLGLPDQARRRDAEARACPAARRDVYNRVNVLLFSAQLHSFLRDLPTTADLSAEVAKLAEDHEFAQMGAIAHIVTGWCRGSHDDLDGIRELESGLDDLQALELKRSAPTYLAYAAEIRLRAGQVAEARAALDRAQAAIDATGERFHAAEVERLRGECCLVSERAETRRRRGKPPQDTVEAERHFERAVAIARAQGAKLWELRAATRWADLLAGSGRGRAARALLAPLYDPFTEGFDTADLREARALLDRIS